VARVVSVLGPELQHLRVERAAVAGSDLQAGRGFEQLQAAVDDREFRLELAAELVHVQAQAGQEVAASVSERRASSTAGAYSVARAVDVSVVATRAVDPVWGGAAVHNVVTLSGTDRVKAT
jgi:hypothetical protein